MDVVEKLERHLRQLAPHVVGRETGQLLQESLCEIKRLRGIMYALLDRDITYIGKDAVLPFDTHDQAINHIIDARQSAKPNA
jgi:hypothetical protein